MGQMALGGAYVVQTEAIQFRSHELASLTSPDLLRALAATQVQAFFSEASHQNPKAAKVHLY